MTAVEWLRNELWEQFKFSFSDNILEQAKEMEKAATISKKEMVEISDEEIEKAWSIVETTHVDKWVSFKSMFIEGAKWYREQLKKK